MLLKDKIKEAALPLAKEIKVSDVRIGLGYTAVLLENGNAGVAYTFRDDVPGGCSAYQNIRPIAGRPATDLIGLFETQDPIENALALATANALFNTTTRKNYSKGDILEKLHLEPTDRVGMVGNFGPLIPAIRAAVEQFHIFEQIDFPQGYLLPVKEAEKLLPQCQVALLTSTAIINHTADHLLELAASCRDIVFLGASTPLAPEVFQNTSVTMLSGVIVTEPQAILQIVSEGGGMRFFKSHVAKVSLFLR